MTDETVDVAFENIPDQLQSRDQWLLWDCRANRPKQPHWNGDHYGISWSDPNDWHAYAEAAEAARENDSWGLGYVNATGNDDYANGMLFAIDVDGAVSETGDLADWVPSLDPFRERDAYGEYSVTDGLKIPVLATSPPEWWTDMDDDDDHIGVEVLANKFTTITGDLIDGFGDEIAVYDDWVDEWLQTASEGLAEAREAYEPQTRPSQDTLAETAQQPTASDSPDDTRPARGGSETTEYDDMAVEEAEDALSHIDPDCGYKKWRNIGDALADEFDTETAVSLFKDWSRGEFDPSIGEGETCDGWDRDARQNAEKQVRGATGGCTAATIAYHASEDDEYGQWTGQSAQSPDPYKAAIARANDEYDAPSDVPDEVAESQKERAGVAEETQGGSEASEESEGGTGWDNVRTLYNLAEGSETEVTKPAARLEAARCLEDSHSWLYVNESERLWVYDDDTGTFGGDGEAQLAQILEDRIETHKTQHEKREIADRLADRNRVDRSELNARDRDDPYLAVGDGVVNLRTGQKHDHDPSYRFIRGVGYDYRPGEADRDAILSFLDDVTEREVDRDTLLDHLAHGLMPGHPYRAFVVAYGPGGNGKTQVSELFRSLVGREHSSAVEIDVLTNDDFSSSDLVNVFVNWGDDMSGDGGGTLTDLSMLKKATGGSEIRANEKFEKTFDFKNEAAMFFSANEPPRIGERKQSIQDRIYPIRMPYRFVSDPDPDSPMEKKKEPGIADELANDDATMRGLLSLAVEHAQSLIASNGEYSQPESPRERLEKYNSEADPIVRFAQSGLQEGGPNDKIRKDDAYKVYSAFVDAWEERAASENGFKRQLSRAVPFELEAGESRALAGADDSERVYVYKRARFTDTAVDYMPDWMIDRYADHFDETPAAEGESEATADATDEVGSADGSGGLSAPFTPADLRQAVVEDTLEEHRDAFTNELPVVRGEIGAFGPEKYGDPYATLYDPSGDAKVKVRLNGPDSWSGAGLQPDTLYEFRGAEWDDRDRDLALTSETEVRPVGVPDASSEQLDELDDLVWERLDDRPPTTAADDGADADSDQQTAADGGTQQSSEGRDTDAPNGDQTATDSEYDGVRGRVMEWLTDDDNDVDTTNVTKTVVELDVPSERARNAIESLAEQGELIGTGDGDYEVVD